MTVYSENNVPILYRGPGERIGLSEEVNKIVTRAHEAAQQALEQAAHAVAVAGDPDSDAYAEARDAQAAVIAEHLLIGEAVVIHNKDEDQADFTVTSIGASDLQEALTEAIGGFDRGHIGDAESSADHIFTPDWVASTHKGLASALADYYSCQVIDLTEVVL